MNTSSSTAPQTSVPPEFQQYLKGPPPEFAQFDFLVGEWAVEARRYQSDGSVQLAYRAHWQAQWLNEGRMLMDDFKALAPDGRALSSFVSLRTFCPSTQRWEMTGLAALQPAISMQWHGQQVGKDRVLEAVGPAPGGQTVHTRIRFFDIQADSFTWESASRVQGQAEWVKTADLQAIRVQNGNKATLPG